jgi:hypothetical protein
MKSSQAGSSRVGILSKQFSPETNWPLAINNYLLRRARFMGVISTCSFAGTGLFLNISNREGSAERGHV